jgi:hypothetical protein
VLVPPWQEFDVKHALIRQAPHAWILGGRGSAAPQTYIPGADCIRPFGPTPIGWSCHPWYKDPFIYHYEAMSSVWVLRMFSVATNRPLDCCTVFLVPNNFYIPRTFTRRRSQRFCIAPVIEMTLVLQLSCYAALSVEDVSLQSVSQLLF